jgi:hypothetical protein
MYAPLMKRILAALLALALPACGGKEIAGDAGPDGAGGSNDGPAGDDASTPDASVDCGQPKHTVYMCTSEMPDSGACPRYGGPGDDAPADASFSVGCVVTLPRCDLNFGDPLTCNCEDVPIGDGGPQWTCPL